MIPARRPKSVQHAQAPSGTVNTPNTSDSEWLAASLVPNRLIHTCSVM